jgi:cold shock protein
MLTFVSHAAEDLLTVQAIVAGLEQRRLRCWYAARDLQLGTSYPRAILSAIAACDVLLVVVSEHAMKSRHVEREIDRADDYGKALLTVRIEDVRLTGAFEYFLSVLQYIDAWPVLLDAHIGRIADAIRAVPSVPTTDSGLTTTRTSTPPEADTPVGFGRGGTVKWFNDAKGFGFVTQDGGGEDVFVHHTAIAAEGFRALAEGQKVDFDVARGPKGLQAQNVRVLA